MIVTNEQIATAVNQAPDVIRASLKDTELFLKDAQRQINYNVRDAADTAIERIKMNLDGNSKQQWHVQNLIKFDFNRCRQTAR